MHGVLRLDDGRLATPNLVPGSRVYDEDLVYLGGREMRTWNPTRSKLAAYLLKGGRVWPFSDTTRVLYLGAANGTTPSHVSDVAPSGLVVSVEFSPRSFRDLVAVAAGRPNLVPVLGDAWRPETYARFAGAPEVLYQDIAQRTQAQILARNVEAFRPRVAYFMIKARSIDVAREPRAVFEEAVAEVAAATGYEVADFVDLAPFEADHACAVFVPPGHGGSPVRERASPPRERFRGREDRAGYRPRPRGDRPYDARSEPPRGERGDRPFDPRRGGPPRGDRPPRGGREGGEGGAPRGYRPRGPPPGRGEGPPKDKRGFRRPKDRRGRR